MINGTEGSLFKSGQELNSQSRAFGRCEVLAEADLSTRGLSGVQLWLAVGSFGGQGGALAELEAQKSGCGFG